MGTRVDPPEYGDDCAFCWEAGKTPAAVWILFTNVKRGDPPGSLQLPNGFLFKCPQDPITNCAFTNNPGGVGWSFDLFRAFGTGRWHVTASHTGQNYFTGFIPDCPQEHNIWTNLFWSPIFFRGWDGFATIIWMDAARDLIEALNIPDGSTTLMELFIKNGSIPVYKFCNTTFSMNHTIEIS